MVEYLSHHPRVKGSSQDIAAGTKRERKKCMFVGGEPFQPSLIFVSIARVELLTFLSLTTNVRHRRQDMALTNTLAYLQVLPQKGSQGK